MINSSSLSFFEFGSCIQKNSFLLLSLNLSRITRPSVHFSGSFIIFHKFLKTYKNIEPFLWNGDHFGIIWKNDKIIFLLSRGAVLPAKVSAIITINVQHSLALISSDFSMGLRVKLETSKKTPKETDDSELHSGRCNDQKKSKTP